MSDIKTEINRRRTFAIISHPDAGKTTLTEKFLLYGGAINLAGSVKGKATARHAVSDWMEIEKERGISVTSSVLQFEYDGYCINILDTPGHQDFSEDTYRTLMAADSAVMVIDASKGVEAQTRKLFKVCVMRKIPIFTFINKMDRDANDTFDLLDEIEKELGIATCPKNWPIGSGKAFKGVYDRDRGCVITYSDTEGNVVTFPEPTVVVECDVVVYPEECPVPVDVAVEGCSDAVVVDASDTYLESQGRIIQLDVTIKNVCPYKRVALAVILTEVDENGLEYQRGMKTLTIPAHNYPSCRDVLVKCIKFVVPEDLDVSGGPVGAMCNQRNFRARFIAHNIDTDYRCCESTVTL